MGLFDVSGPKLGGGSAGIEVIEFDVLFEETLEATVEVTQYPIEAGAVASDHIIIPPKQYRIIGGVGTRTLKPGIADVAGGVISNFTDGGVAGGIISGAAGFSAGALGGSDGKERASATLTKIMKLMTDRKPFTYVSDDITLENMVISAITRTRTKDTEQGLIFEATLQELPTLDAVIQANKTNPTVLTDDPASTQVVNDIDTGEVTTRQPSVNSSNLGAAIV